MFVPTFRYALTEYDPQRPWLLVGQVQHLTVELESDQSFAEWAAKRWPPPRFSVGLEPGPLAPWQSPG